MLVAFGGHPRTDVHPPLDGQHSTGGYTAFVDPLSPTPTHRTGASSEQPPDPSASDDASDMMPNDGNKMGMVDVNSSEVANLGIMAHLNIEC